MDNIIADNQSAFLKGRNILDGILILNEAYDEANRIKLKRFFFKVDFAKAYDSVNWDFLEQMMRGLNFNENWRKWIMECVKTASTNVLINGSPCGEFKMKRGLRQGDPISHFLYLIIAEGLNLLIRKATEEGLLKVTEIGTQGIHISHLQYADDTIFLCDGGIENLVIIKRILQLFELASDLKVNFGKSKIYGMNSLEPEMAEAAKVLGCDVGRGQMVYLGMQVGVDNHRKDN
ncbi:hypothetical protein ACS0TY_026816 [Phlomoides rotata]